MPVRIGNYPNQIIIFKFNFFRHFKNLPGAEPRGAGA
jgi:hypothetical protein